MTDSSTAGPDELTDRDVGVYLVTTLSGSVYRFHLDASSTVERVGGDRRPRAAPADVLQPLRSIILLRVGQPGRWWMRNTSGGYTDPSELWQWSSKVVRIEPDEDAERSHPNSPPDHISELPEIVTTPIATPSDGA